MRTIFYRRNGTRVSRSWVRRSKLAYVEAKRVTGQLGCLTVSIQPTVADAYERMTEEEYGTFTGSFTYRKTHSGG